MVYVWFEDLAVRFRPSYGTGCCAVFLTHTSIWKTPSNCTIVRRDEDVKATDLRIQSTWWKSQWLCSLEFTMLIQRRF